MNSSPAIIEGIHARVLLVEDDPHILEILCEILCDDGHLVIEARDGKEALDRLEEQPIDLMVLDLKLPRVQGMDVLEHTVKNHPGVPVIILTSKGTIATAVEATRLGAYDFLEKPPDMRRIKVTIRNALEKYRLQHERDFLVGEARERYRMVGASKPMQKVFRLIDKAAASDAGVLILGETGSGKELVARAIHMNGSRAGGPFIAVNCAALPADLIENELFGHEKGAFTGALSQQKGRFEQAHGGTLFLDEIGDMSPMSQARVLRALGESTIDRLGGGRSIPIDVRVIAATNKDLAAEIQAGNFREDLYYRLNIFEIQVPSLRDRRDDIWALVGHFLTNNALARGMPKKSMELACIPLFMEQPWTGNVRQLEHTVERLMAMSEGPVITAGEVAQALNTPHTASSPSPSLREAREQFERSFILHTLLAHDWKILESADALGIDRTHLWKKIKQMGLEQS